MRVKPYVGRYPFNFLRELTIREWGWVKRNTGYLPLTVDDALEGGDPELVGILAVIAMVRAGRIGNAEVAEVYEWLLDTDAKAAITVWAEDDDEEEGEEGRPPTLIHENGAYFGDGSKTKSDLLTETPAPFGTVASDISPSVQERSAS